MEPITKKPNEAAHGGATGPAHVSVTLTSSASPKGRLNFAYFPVVSLEDLLPLPGRETVRFFRGRTMWGVRGLPVLAGSLSNGYQVDVTTFLFLITCRVSLVQGWLCRFHK